MLLKDLQGLPGLGKCQRDVTSRKLQIVAVVGTTTKGSQTISDPRDLA